MKIGWTMPIDGCCCGIAATRTSPSGSLSLSITGSSAEPPGRTPKESSSAIGGVFTSLRSGSVDSTVSCVESSSFSVSPSGGVRSFQLSTRCRLSFAIHAAPPTASFRMITSRFTRKTRPAESWASSMAATTSFAVPSHSRTKAPDPAQAPYVQPRSQTGAAGAPSPPASVTEGSAPSRGTRTSSEPVATATASVCAEACCRTAPSAFGIPVRNPPGVITAPAAASSTTGVRPTAVMVARPDESTSPSDAAEGSSASPSLSTATVTTSPRSLDRAKTVPSCATATSAFSPSSATGSAASISNEAIPRTGTTHRAPDFVSRIAAVLLPSATFAAPGMPAESPSDTRAGSTAVTVDAPPSTTSTFVASWRMS